MKKKPDTSGKLQPIDAEAILNGLSEIRNTVQRVSSNWRKPGKRGAKQQVTDRNDPQPPAVAGDQAAMIEFDYRAVVDALEQVGDEIEESIDAAKQQLLDFALDVYYATEALSKDPNHPEAREHAERMRTAYEKEYGTPIPAKEATEEERRRRNA